MGRRIVLETVRVQYCTVDTYADAGWHEGHAGRNLVSRTRSSSADSADLIYSGRAGGRERQPHLIGKRHICLKICFPVMFARHILKAGSVVWFFASAPTPHPPPPLYRILFSVFWRFHLLRSVLRTCRQKQIIPPVSPSVPSLFPLSSFSLNHFSSRKRTASDIRSYAMLSLHTHLPVMILLQVFLDIYKGLGASNLKN